jgi:hypothetical protein
MAYNQEFFLDLASKGKSAWTAWRCDPANKYERVTFAGVDFSEGPRDRIDFSGEAVERFAAGMRRGRKGSANGALAGRASSALSSSRAAARSPSRRAASISTAVSSPSALMTAA